MGKVKAEITDDEWFQIYYNLNKCTEKFIASGLRWNYFYHTWKTVSYSPFANAVVFVTNDASISNPATLSYTVQAIDTSDYAEVITLVPATGDTLGDRNANFIQTEDLTELGIGMQPYGAIFIPIGVLDDEDSIDVTAALGSDTYTGSIQIVADDTVGSEVPAVAVGDTITLTKDA